jgi:hypothetical protein
LRFLPIYGKAWGDDERPHEMATFDTLDFLGRRWPAVRVTSSSGPPRRPALRSGSRGFGRRITDFDVGPDVHASFWLEASGAGQEWSADRPLAFWRNFSAILLTSREEAEPGVLRFFARHGDPTGQLERRAAAGEPLQTETDSWISLTRRLRQVALAWNEVDALGISSISDDAQRLAAADQALRILLPKSRDRDRQIVGEIETIYGEHGLTRRPLTLRAFMALSAASARERRIAMRRCAYPNCLDWFELRRTDAIFCSGSCQAADHKRRNQING